MSTTDALRIFLPAVVTFLIGVGITPIVTHFLYKFHFWKPRGGKIALDGTTATTETGRPLVRYCPVVVEELAPSTSVTVSCTAYQPGLSRSSVVVTLALVPSVLVDAAGRCKSAQE